MADTSTPRTPREIQAHLDELEAELEQQKELVDTAQDLRDRAAVALRDAEAILTGRMAREEELRHQIQDGNDALTDLMNEEFDRRSS